jgi:hypothetical protein
MTSSDKPAWRSKKFWMAALGLGVLVVLAHFKADGNAYLAAGGIVATYCGGQAMVDHATASRV